MTREIKFRAWNGVILINNFAHIGENGRMFTIHHGAPEPEYKVMQYTGLKDKNGVEIYEGDILLNTTIKPQKIKIVFDKKAIGTFGGAFKIEKLQGEEGMTWRYDMDKLEVIGNIYQNKDLLK